MSDVTGDITTCPRASGIFICKYCEYDTVCGEQIKAMTEEERNAHFTKINEEFEKWRQQHFPYRGLQPKASNNECSGGNKR